MPEPGHLGIAERQMVKVAKALWLETGILVMDQPPQPSCSRRSKSSLRPADQSLSPHWASDTDI
ncbi:MAG: hypothetical protein M3R52_00235, partial [Acidobacteriota bacterium]|nr:hypothetical protein [Acidobacteriota bacterium]